MWLYHFYRTHFILEISVFFMAKIDADQLLTRIIHQDKQRPAETAS